MSYIQFEQRPQPVGRKTPVFDVLNNDGHNLGIIAFYPNWRKFVFQAQPETVYDAGCLNEITVFVKAQTDAWMAGL